MPLALFSTVPVSDLIETLWNVKILPVSLLVYDRVRFNRDIVECKACRNVIAFQNCCDLIETLWNVKLTIKLINNVADVDLIETLWNVKMNRKEIFFT